MLTSGEERALLAHSARESTVGAMGRRVAEKYTRFHISLWLLQPRDQFALQTVVS